eukprot:CAMPEP_0174238538 /NCGR_PEP_ID=MMETSP0417-20130205/11572_1 /TAXON_ID=242541 /ORGANISM="Mayorella sp, Strain BSH-02190019" /LENGTH=725 /DNA_ID=CAMNT_0015317381 /DNA_START=421 /DNA_END=2594 /DNA_ORIENTATION=-
MPFESTPCGGRVVAHFEGQNSKELTLAQGDMVTVLTLHDDGWCTVDFQGKSGLFPSTYLEEAEQVPPPVAPKPKPAPKPAPLRRNMSAGPSATGEGGGATQWRPGSSYSKANSSADVRRGASGSPLLRNAVVGGRGAGLPSRPSRPATSYSSTSPGSRDGPSIGGRAGVRPGTSYGDAQGGPDFSNPRNTIATSTLGVKEEVEIAQKRERQRRHVVEELIATERDYVNDLEVVLAVFVRPLQTNSLVKPIDMQSLFSNLEVLAGFNATVLKQFEERIQTNIFGDIFLQMADFFKMYTAYCANQPNALKTLEKYQKNTAFQKFLEECTLNPETRGLTLFSFLIKPIQRICKYPLLLKDLLKNTAEDHPDFDNLQKAMNKIQEVVDYVNERKRLSENLMKIYEVQRLIDGNEVNDLVEPTRRLVREDVLTIKSKRGKASPKKIFLFNDMLLYVKDSGKGRYKFGGRIGLDDAKLVDIADTGSVKNAFEIASKSKSSVLCTISAASIEDKRSWMKDIKLIVKDYQRKEALEKKAAAETTSSSPRLGPITAAQPIVGKLGSSPAVVGSAPAAFHSSSSSASSSGPYSSSPLASSDGPPPVTRRMNSLDVGNASSPLIQRRGGIGAPRGASALRGSPRGGFGVAPSPPHRAGSPAPGVPARPSSPGIQGGAPMRGGGTGTGFRGSPARGGPGPGPGRGGPGPGRGGPGPGRGGPGPGRGGPGPGRGGPGP